MKIDTFIVMLAVGLASQNNHFRRPDESDDEFPEWSDNFNVLPATQVGPSCQTFVIINAFRVCKSHNGLSVLLNAQEYFNSCSYKNSNRFIHAAIDEVIAKPPKTSSGKVVTLEEKIKGISYRKENKINGLGLGTYSKQNAQKLHSYLLSGLKSKGPILSTINSDNLDYELLEKRKARDFNSPLIKNRKCNNDDVNKDDHNHAILILNRHYKHPETKEVLYEIMDSNQKFTYFLTEKELVSCAFHEFYQIDCSKVIIKDSKRRR